MENIDDLIRAIDSEGWTVVSTAPGHATTCRICLYAALNGMSLAGTKQTTTGFAGNNHWATITRK